MENESKIVNQDNSDDMSEFELADTAVLTVQNLQRTDDMLYKGKPVKITIYSPGSTQGVRALHKVGIAAQIRLRATLQGKVDKDGGKQADEERVAKLVAITANIENLPTTDPRKVYSNPKAVDIANQVDEFFGNLVNFSKASTPI